MISLHPSTLIPATSGGGCLQTLTLQDEDRILGRAVWTAADASQGVVQILELWIDPSVRRRGHGRSLLRGLIEQARLFTKPGKKNVRRLWVAIGHKSKVVGRSFLTGEGFHHISTTGGLLQDEDQLIYVKSLD